jgi:DNA invertase Pin-like site-specific DNA recombinase
VLDFLSAGDVLMVTRIDRLARSIGDLQDIVRAVKAKGASLKRLYLFFNVAEILGSPT